MFFFWVITFATMFFGTFKVCLNYALSKQKIVHTTILKPQTSVF